MQLKPGYKQTEVGVIPEEWEVKPFRDAYSDASRNGIYKPVEFHGRGTRIPLWPPADYVYVAQVTVYARARDAQLGEDAHRDANRTGAPVFSFLRTIVM